MIRACEASGLAALPSDDRIGGATVCPGWLDSVKRVRDEYAAASPAFAGFRLADEPISRQWTTGTSNRPPGRNCSGRSR